MTTVASHPVPVLRAGRLDGVALAVACLVLCAALGQTTELIDSSGYLIASQRGINGNTRHVVFTPMLIAWTKLLSPLPLSHLAASRLLGAFMCALATAFAHATARCVGLDRARAAIGAALVAACPIVVFAGTVVGPYASMFGVASIALWLAASAARSGARSAAFWAGAVTGFAGTVHATGNLLPGLIVPLLFTLRRELAPRARCGGLIALCMFPVIGHAVAAFAYVGLASIFGWHTGALLSGGFVAQLSGTALDSLGTVPGMILHEWLMPLLPVCLVPILLLVRRKCRSVVIALWLPWLGYLALNLILLQGGTAAGVYMLPFTIPAALLAARALTPRLGLVAVAIALSAAVVKVAEHDEPERALGYVTGLHAATAGEPAYLVCGIGVDIDAIFAHMPEQDYFFLPDLVMHATAAVAAALPSFDALIDARIAAGEQVFLTENARLWLEKMSTFPADNPGGLLLAHLAARYTLERVESSGFRAQRLAPKAR